MAPSFRPPAGGAAGFLLLALAIALPPSVARAHDPSAFGGLFRTRDGGATWFVAQPLNFLSGAIALAISPVDPNHLLLATDSGLLRSRNAGRDWKTEAPNVVIGPAFAAAFNADGQRALVSASSVIVRTDGEDWRSIRAPTAATPARALVAGLAAGRVYLAGWSGLYRSDDWGDSWVSVAEGLPDEPAIALLVAPGPPEIVYAVADGRLWASLDAARHWEPRAIPSGRVEALTSDPVDPARLWVVASGRVYRSDDRGKRWLPVGRPLPEQDVMARGIAVSTPVILLATDRGLFRSADNGERWELLAGNLPAHLEAGVLVRDPTGSSLLYAGFALVPFDELLRQAVEGRSALQRLSLTTLAGGAAFLILLMLGGLLAMRRLARYYRAPRDVSSTLEKVKAS